MTDTPSVSILIVSYNTREMTLDCLRSVVAETLQPFELIVVDNASTDGSAEAIAREFPDIRLFIEEENLGFALANNRAAEQAHGEFLLLLNPDTVILDGAIDKVLAFAARKPEAKIWGGRTYYGDGSLNRTSCWRRMTLWNIFCRTVGLTSLFPGSQWLNSEAYGNWERDTVRHVDVVTGCFLLIKKADWDALGGFDLRFVMYGEEVDLCLRASSDLGARPHITPDAGLIHYGGASQSVRSDKMVRLLRAKTELVKRHFPAWNRPFAQALFRLWPLSRYLAARALTFVRGRAPGQGALVWGEVWRRRAEWEKGFDASA
jgi:GT2 family glycosyltransferase